MSATPAVRYADYPREVAEDVVRLRRRLDRANVPPRRSDHNLVVGTWNIRHFGRVHPEWTENPDSPKRNLRGMAYIAEVVRRFDVIAIQEVKRETDGIRMLVDDFLGPDWGVLLSDVSAGQRGNVERLAYVYDRRRLTPSGLAGEIVLPPDESDVPVEQFDRTPYVVGFRIGHGAEAQRFALLTAHIRFGETPADRIEELANLARFTAREMRDRARTEGAEEVNLIVLGDFNIERRSENPLFDAFIAEGLTVPPQIRELSTTVGTEARHYDQIAWFMGDLTLLYANRAGVVDFAGAVFRELTPRQMTDRVSDHFPLWVEFIIDRSGDALAATLGVDPGAPDPFSGIPD